MTFDFLNVREAAKMAHMSVQHISKLARLGAFPASKPRSDKGGWHISRPAFEHWWTGRIRSTSNNTSPTAK